MKASELREKSVEELGQQLNALLKSNLTCVCKATGQLDTDAFTANKYSVISHALKLY